MDIAGNIREGEQLDWNALEKHLRVNLENMEGTFEVQQFHGGHANLTYLIKFGDQELVMRRPPFGKLAPGTHSMKREYRVLSELYKHFPPAPRAYHLCTDPEVIGAEFIIMQRKNGIVVRKKMHENFETLPNAHDRVAKAVIKAQADLHNVDVVMHNLTHLGKPTGFLERQLIGWTKRWEHSKTEENKDMEMLLSNLKENPPTTQRTSIIHNDIKPDNCQFQSDDPDTVTALFDWDMATLGDPLVDFGSTLGFWPDDFFSSIKDFPVMLEGNWPNKQFLKDCYSEFSGLDLGRIGWYEALGLLRASIICQQLFKRFHDGETKDPRMKSFGEVAKVMAKLALTKMG